MIQAQRPTLPARYTAGSLLGQGGSGRVYQVHDSIRDLDLALKLVTPVEAAWLRREFDALRQIRHENLIRVFDWGALESGESYYTMELVTGEDWGRRAGEAQAPEEVRRILTGVLRGIAHLHSHDEIHGDLKPGNILLGREGLIKVTDVGMGGRGERHSSSPATPGYSAPETWEGATPDIRSDLYSVGVMAYEAVAGHHPFAARTVREVILGQLEGWLPSPTVHAVAVPPDLERALMRAVERNPALRQASADEFMEMMGVQDRFGEILGGAVVGRSAELTRIQKTLASDLAGSPTLIHILGPPGSGKSAFLEEAANFAAASGARSVPFGQFSGLSLADLAREISGATPPPLESLPLDLQTASETIWNSTRSTPVLLFFHESETTSSLLQNIVRPLARYLWALSIERDLSSRILFLVEGHEPHSGLDEFEQEIRLEAISVEGLPVHAESMLGKVAFDQRSMNRLWSLSGGLPESLWLVLRDLVKRGILDRINGVWTLREVEQLTSLEAPSLTERWQRDWHDLSDAGKGVLAILCLLPRGVDHQLAQNLGLPGFTTDCLTSLENRGWLRLFHGRWCLSSDGVGHTVRMMAGGFLTDGASTLRSHWLGQLDREERAELLMMTEGAREALSEGKWSAEYARERGDLNTASSRFRRCLELAISVNDGDAEASISFELAEALHLLGEDDKAETLLTTHMPRGKVRGDKNLPARKEHLLGRILSSRGMVDGARLHFRTAADLAAALADRALFLRSHAELAELDWRYGSERSRKEAIDRIQTVLQTVNGVAGLANERAALTYGVGAALVVQGKAQAAQEVLLSGIEDGTSDYWRARITNALGAAAAGLGDNSAALKWYADAWSLAEKANAFHLKGKILSNRGARLHASGRIRESIEFDRQAAVWARRLGNKFDYMAACAGTAIGLIYLGQYEQALHDARETVQAAVELSDEQDLLKGMEMESLALFHIGDYQQAQEILERADDLAERLGQSRFMPRILWLWGKIHRVLGNPSAAETRLRVAEETLLANQDLEDLWGIQIELNGLRCNRQIAASTVVVLNEVISRARAAAIPVAELSGWLALAEILGTFELNHRQYTGELVEAVGRAERDGFIEMSWRLSYWLGVLVRRDGESRASQVRFGHAMRLIRGIAEGLSPKHRQLYLAIPHVRSALANMTLAV